MKGCLRKCRHYQWLCLLVFLSSGAYASGYKLEFQSTSVLADAGEAAVVEDAGTNWYNAAGLVYLPQQFVGSLIDVYAPASFSGTVTAPSTLTPPASFFGSNYAASGGASSHPNTFLPALHYSIPFKERFAFGMSVVPAWGFTEDYGRGSILRYDLTRVYTKTIDIAPSLAWMINEHWSLGAGPDFHYFSVQSRDTVNTHAPAIGLGDSVSRFTGSDWAYGGHIGILFHINEATRMGLNYRSQMIMHLNGYSDFAGPGIGSFESNAFKLNVPLPATSTLSIYRDVTPVWALMGTIAYDQWGSLKDYHARNYVQPIGTLPSVIVVQNMGNTFDFSVGTHYTLNDQWMLRGSIKYEGTPTSSAYRDVNFPDGNKLGFQIGSRYQMNKKLALDLIYGHVFIKTMHISSINPVTHATAFGHSVNSVELAGAQIVWNI